MGLHILFTSSQMAMDDFEESEHPRDSSGKFKTGTGENALSSSEKSYIVNSHVGMLIKNAGFKKAKTGDNLLTFQHPSGAKVIIHPPASGKKSSSKWTHASSGEMNAGKPFEQSGEGIALAKVLGTAVKKAEEKKQPTTSKEAPEAAPKAVEVSAPEAGETLPAKLKPYIHSNGTVNLSKFLQKEHGYTGPVHLGNGITEVTKSNGAKIEIDSKDGTWLAMTPGFATKQGNGSADLAKLLSGEKAYEKDGGYSWNNTDKKTLVQTPTEKKSSSGEGEEEYEEVPSESATATLKKLIKAAPAPTSSQKNAAKSYTGSGYASMNKSLRAGGSLSGQSKDFNDWLMSAEFPQDVTLHRKVGGEYATILKSILGPGAKFYEKGFSSTSTHDGVWHGSVHLKINVKKGHKGAAVKHLSEHAGENEVVLPVNSAFIYKGYDPATHEVTVDLDQSHYGK